MSDTDADTDEVGRFGEAPPDRDPAVDTDDDPGPAGEEDVDIGVLAEVPPDQRLDVDEGEDGVATAGGLDDDLDDLYADPGEVVDLAADAGDAGAAPDEARAEADRPGAGTGDPGPGRDPGSPGDPDGAAGEEVGR